MIFFYWKHHTDDYFADFLIYNLSVCLSVSLSLSFNFSLPLSLSFFFLFCLDMKYYGSLRLSVIVQMHYYDRICRHTRGRSNPRPSDNHFIGHLRHATLTYLVFTMGIGAGWILVYLWLNKFSRLSRLVVFVEWFPMASIKVCQDITSSYQVVDPWRSSAFWEVLFLFQLW